MNTARRFFVKHDTTGKFVAVVEGETGFYGTTVHSQPHADELNRRAGHSPAQVEAAKICSMFGNWHKFNSITSHLEADA